MTLTGKVVSNVVVEGESIITIEFVDGTVLELKAVVNYDAWEDHSASLEVFKREVQVVSVPLNKYEL